MKIIIDVPVITCEDITLINLGFRKYKHLLSGGLNYPLDSFAGIIGRNVLGYEGREFANVLRKYKGSANSSEIIIKLYDNTILKTV